IPWASATRPPARWHRRPSETSAGPLRHSPRGTLTRILPTRSLAAWCALATVSCAAPPSPVQVRARVELPPQPPVDLRIALRPEHVRDQVRYLQAASSAVRACASALGRFDTQELALAEPAWNGPPSNLDAVVLDRVQWW